MIVSELIDLLKRLPPDAEVLVFDWSCEMEEPIPLTFVEYEQAENQVLLQDPY